MKYFLEILILWILFPLLVVTQICPNIQSVIPLKRSATTSNLSLAVIANGKYYLLADNNDMNVTEEIGSGGLPNQFERSRLITVVDKTDCNESKYHLIAIKSLNISEDKNRFFYSTLDLKNWSNESQWTQPKSIWELPLFDSDPILSLVLTSFDGTDIEDIIQTFFVWDKTKTLFVVTKPLQIRGLTNEEIHSRFRFYSINMKESCNETYSYSKSIPLGLTLKDGEKLLDLCFVSEDNSDSLLYCFSGDSFTVHMISTKFECNKTVNQMTDHYFLPNPELNTSVETEVHRRTIRIGCKADVLWSDKMNLSHQPSYQLNTSSVQQNPIKDKTNTFWVIIIVVVTILLLLGLISLALLITSDRNRLNLVQM